MCSTPKPPAAPDPYKVADAQYQYNTKAATDAARLNAVDQYGPYGSTTYQRNADGTPSSQTVNLSPEVQKWLDSQFGQSTALQEATTKQLGYLPQDRFQLPSGPDAEGLAREQFGDQMLDPAHFGDTGAIATASYDQAKSLFQPDIDAAKKQMEVTLAQRGINPGDEIYNDEMSRLDRNANNAYAGAGRQATLDAGSEQSRRVNSAVTARNSGSNAYQTNLSNQLLERNQPYSEAAALMGTTPQFQSPSFMNTAQTNVSAPDYQGAVNNQYNAQMGQYNAANAQKQGTMSSIAGLVGTGISLFSDEDMKEDRHTADGEDILAAFRDMPVDDYRYKDEAQAQFGLPERRTGPMAQDYEHAFGGEGSDGETIDIGDYLGKIMGAIKALDARTMGARAHG